MGTGDAYGVCCQHLRGNWQSLAVVCLCNEPSRLVGVSGHTMCVSPTAHFEESMCVRGVELQRLNRRKKPYSLGWAPAVDVLRACAA